eukprot:3564039-Amphidinium_carterae.2
MYAVITAALRDAGSGAEEARRQKRLYKRYKSFVVATKQIALPLIFRRELILVTPAVSSVPLEDHYSGESSAQGPKPRWKR